MTRPAGPSIPLLALVSAILAACGSSEPEDRVVIMGLDGLDRVQLERMMAEGELPNFQRLRAEGAMADLAVPKPVLSPIVWTTLASGYPGELHGIGGWTSAQGRTFTGADVRTLRLWDVASQQGVASVVSGYLMTWPASPVPGAMLSDRFAWSFPMNKDPSDPTIAMSEEQHAGQDDLIQPPSLAERARQLQPDAEALADHRLAYQIDEYDGPFHPWPRDALHLAFWADQWEAPAWGAEGRPRLGMMHLVLADQVSHLYWAFSDPYSRRILRQQPEARSLSAADDRALHSGRRLAPYSEGLLTPEQLEAGSRWVPDAYRALDDALGEVMERVDPADTTLLVLSDHGFQASSARPELNGGHRVPAVLMAWGNRVKAGVDDPDASVFDVAPTVARLLGLPGARDHTGQPLEALFELPEAVEPLDTWLLPRVALDLDGGPRTAEEERLMTQLEALGYVDSLGAPILGASRQQGQATQATRPLPPSDHE